MKKRYKWIIVILITFILINIIWYINYSMYSPYKEGYQKFKTCYNRSNKEYEFTVKQPAYTSFTGNLAIANKRDTLSIIIWPGLFMTQPFEYGAIIYDEESQHGYMLYVDENMNYLETEKNQLSPDEIKNAKLVLKNMRRS